MVRVVGIIPSIIYYSHRETLTKFDERGRGGGKRGRVEREGREGVREGEGEVESGVMER